MPLFTHFYGKSISTFICIDVDICEPVISTVFIVSIFLQQYVILIYKSIENGTNWAQFRFFMTVNIQVNMVWQLWRTVVNLLQKRNAHATVLTNNIKSINFSISYVMHKTDTLSDSYFVNVLRNLRNVLYTSVKMQTVIRLITCKLQKSPYS